MNVQKERGLGNVKMHRSQNTDVETCIAELKSDIVKVTLQLDKIKCLTGNGQPDSRELTNETADMGEIIKTLDSESRDESRFKLQNLLNEKMIEMETQVLKLISDPGDTMPSSSMSRLPAWTQLLERHLWTYCPESVPNTPRVPTCRSLALSSDQVAPIQNLLWHHSVTCNAQPNAPDYLAVAAVAIGAKIGVLYKKIESQRAELSTMKENPDQETEERIEDADIKNDLIAANENVLHLTKRVNELGKVTSHVQNTLKKEKADHELDLQFSKKCRKK